MRTEHDDAVTKALALLRQTAPGEDRDAKESSLSPVSGDIGELFLAELQTRRKRLSQWIRLMNEEAHLSGGRTPLVRGSRYRCRRLRLPPGAEQRAGVRRHSTAA
jgi:hypothetical protein